MAVIVAGIDIETTGLSQEDGHRIIEVGIGMYRTDDGRTFSKIGRTWLKRINPLRAIDPGAQAVHHIDIKDLAGCPEWVEVAPTVSKLLSAAHLVVAHNAEFDCPFVALELVRIGLPMPKFDVFCTMKEGRQATALGKLPSLAELAWAFGYNYDQAAAHAADYDIDLTMKCFFKGVEQGVFNPPALNRLLTQVA